MPDSGRTFSQKSLYEDLEDSFFRNIMAVYCEKESEKLLEEMKSSSEKPENLSPINKIYRKLHRSASLTSAFRVLKKITDRVVREFSCRPVFCYGNESSATCLHDCI